MDYDYKSFSSMDELTRYINIHNYKLCAVVPSGGNYIAVYKK